MSNLNTDLIARIYAASDTPLTNEELEQCRHSTCLSVRDSFPDHA